MLMRQRKLKANFQQNFFAGHPFAWNNYESVITFFYKEDLNILSLTGD